MGDTITFEHTGFLVTYLMDLAFELLDKDGFPETVSAILLLMMVAFVIRCGLNIYPTWRRLYVCQNKLKKIEMLPNGITDLHEFEAEVTGRSDPLKGNWLQFRKTLVRRGHLDCLTALPAVFINLGKLELEAPLRRLGKWSALFVGIGLFVTFFGIVAALKSATKAIEAATPSGVNNTVDMQQALKDANADTNAENNTKELFKNKVYNYQIDFLCSTVFASSCICANSA